MPPLPKQDRHEFDLFINRATMFKIGLLAGVIIVSALFVWYTFSIIQTLQEDARSQAEQYVQLWQLAVNAPESGEELQIVEFIFNEIIVNASFPIVVLDESRQPVHWRNIADISYSDTALVTREKINEIAEQMYQAHGEYPINFGETAVNYLRYGESDLIKQLRIMPFATIGVVVTIMIIGMIGFQNIRRSEERHIWVGMAKETAHQLGTPISSLMGWLDLMEVDCIDRSKSDPSQKTINDAVENMQVDVTRLQRVANRFGQIGSVPELVSCDLNQLVDEVTDYYRRRLPFEGQGIQITFEAGNIPEVEANPELFTWTLENLIKNSLQVVDSKTGQVNLSTSLTNDRKCVLIRITDNGSGISAAAARKIFRPGFTTKKRGWGLGLTLVKRIIEEYHRGQIWLEESAPGKTQFSITLQISSQQEKN